MKVIVTGATGLIGKKTVIYLAQAGHRLTSIVRREGSASELPGNSVQWDPMNDPALQLSPALKDSDVVIHLAGEPVAKGRWSKRTKNAILNSRILGTRGIVDAIRNLPMESRPKTLICASAIGIYGNRGDEVLIESSARGEGFLADTVAEWEAEAQSALELGVRLVTLRIGVVLSPEGGALEKMKPVILGAGNQWMSWVHLEDVVRFIKFAIENEKVVGTLNVVSPHPVTNAEFTRRYAQSIHQPLLLRAPEFAIRSALGEMSQIVLNSSRVSSEKSNKIGFRYEFENIESALQQIYGALKKTEKRFSAVQFVPKPLEEVFHFFSLAENLETLTPPWLNFRILKKTTSEIQENTLIDYQLKIHGIPVRWRTKIERWIPNVEFVDTQLRGPYAKWHHTHRFEKVEGGTLVFDDVVYRLPGGVLGNFIAAIPIRKDIERIFSYRKMKIAEALR